MKFTEAQLEEAIIELLGEQGYPHLLGEAIRRGAEEVLIRDDLQEYLREQYAEDGITDGEIVPELAGITNAQGRAAAMDARFLHLELSLAARTALTEDSALRSQLGRVLSTLAEPAE